MRKRVKEKKSLLRIITRILVVITVIAYVMAAFRISNYSSNYYYDQKVSNYLYDIEANRFGGVYTTALDDMRRDISYDSDVMECRALGFYYEQAVLEKAYREAGNEEKARAFAEKKAEYEKELGSMASKIKDVEAILQD